MKSLFSRLRHGRDTPPPATRPSSSASLDKQALHPPHPSRRSSSSTVPDERSSTPIAAQHSQSSYASSESAPNSFIAEENDEDVTFIGVVGDETIRARTISTSDGVKRVTFRSPVPTPTTSVVLDEMTASHLDSRAQPSTRRVVPTSPAKKASFSSSRPPSAQSRSTSRQSLPSSTKPLSTRKSSVPPSPTKSAKSPAPSEHSFGGMSYLPPPNSWSEMAEDDLIANLSPRERTRQEVLWEIVSSEERYVQELIKLNETFCRYLLPPSATSPHLELYDPSDTLSRTLSPTLSPTPSSPTESLNYLPIAAQYTSGLESPPIASVARMNAYNILTNGRPGPSRNASSTNIAGPRSHQSLPPPKRDTSGGQSISSRMSYHPGGKGKGRDSRNPSDSSIPASVDAPIPEELEKVLRVLANGILEGHMKLAAALRRRYENQYPLVRSLADVFTSHSYILREYATYVMHLERALEQVENALTQYTAAMSKRASRRMEETELGQVGKVLLALEELAAERGESGLTISLSKPFQRLLKYPLLFQNLLFNTDPSLKEYEATLAMVDEVEDIVRTIEDEKATMEEREKTRDVLARIDGLERDKLLIAPKPNRLLVNEMPHMLTDTDVRALKEVSKQKKSFRRLSDILKGSPESSDLWIVKFSDVSLLCERTGLTQLPISNFKATRSDSLPELSGRSRFATSGKRASLIKARNLYRFVKVDEWHLEPKSGSTEGLLTMDEISQSRSPAPASSRPPVSPEKHPVQQPETPQKPTKLPLKGDGGPSPARSTPRRRDADTETMVSDRLSVMSFAFNGSDQIKPVPRRVKPSVPPAAPAARKFSTSNAAAVYPQRRTSAGHVIGKEANAKFAHRLRSQDQNSGDATARPASRARQSLPPAMSIRAGRASPALSPTERNGNMPRQTVSSSTAPDKLASGKAASIAPSTKESVRGISGAKPTSRMETSVSGTGRRVVPRATRDAHAIRPSASTEVAGMWTAYRQGGAVGTPKRPPPNRALGGKI